MGKLEEMVKRVQDERAKQATQDPSSPDAKKTTRVAGLIALVAGLLFAGGAYYLYEYQGRISVLLSAITLTFLAGGLYLIAFGKMPKPK